MEHFKTIFGLPREDIRSTVLLLPFIPAGALAALHIPKLNAGAIFAAASNDHITVIRTGQGASFVGDAVLYLKDCPMKQILFLGSCGLINTKLGLSIGSLVLPSTFFALESFSDLAAKKNVDPLAASPDTALRKAFTEHSGLNLPPIAGVSFGSLALENEYIPVFKRLGADIIDMECAALFLAAHKIKTPAMALLFVSDILEEKLFYTTPSDQDKKCLAQGISQALNILQSFSLSLKS